MRLLSCSSSMLLAYVPLFVLAQNNETSAPTDAADSTTEAPTLAPADKNIISDFVNTTTTTIQPTTISPTTATMLPPTDQATAQTTTTTPTTTPTAGPMSIYDVLQSNNSSIAAELFGLLATAGYDDVDLVSGSGPLTVLAPNDAGFDKLPPGKLDELKKPENVEELYSILSYHVIPDNVQTSIFQDGDEVGSVGGDTIKISYTDPSHPSLNDGQAKVVQPDLLAPNGIIHIIDSILSPPQTTLENTDKSMYNIIKDNPSFSTLGLVVDAARLSSVLSSPGNYTLFGPDNAAFMKLDTDTFAKYLEGRWLFHLQDMLLYHALPSAIPFSNLADGTSEKTANGEDMMINLNPARINGDTIIDVNATDMLGNNGIMHGIKDVLLPTSATSTIVDLAMTNPALSTLIDLINNTGLVDEFAGPGPFTLFAPIDEAFDVVLPSLNMEELRRSEKIETLARTLKYHVVVDSIYHSSQFKDEELMTEMGPITISVSGPSPMVNNATIIGTDTLASNGIVHLLSSVLMPPERTETATPTAAPTDEEAVTPAPTMNTTVEPMDPATSVGNILSRSALVGCVLVGTVAMLLLLF